MLPRRTAKPSHSVAGGEHGLPQESAPTARQKAEAARPSQAKAITCACIQGSAAHVLQARHITHAAGSRKLGKPSPEGAGAENKPAARGDSDHLHPKAHVHFIVECLVERQIGKHVESNHVHL